MASLLMSPGLGAEFILDDFQNLKWLDNLSEGSSLNSIWQWSLTQYSGLTRFLPLFTFALQRDAWPDHPEQFLLINLAIHVFCGFLVFLLARRLALILTLRSPDWLGLAVSAFWLINPLQVASALYVVQRMNQMSTMFVLLGLLAYLRGRCLNKSPLLAYAWMLGGLLLGGGLAFACKENAVLMPLLILAAEVTVLSHLPKLPAWRVWRIFVFYVPIAIIVLVGMYYHESYILLGYNLREFSLFERLLTQTQVMPEYLSGILWPSVRGLGVFHDDFPVASWPLSGGGVLKILLTIGLLAFGFLFRNIYPLVCFGILWFFAGHALESSVLPLELYFEHRNYLPIFGVAWVVVVLASKAIEHSQGVLRKILPFFLTCWFLLMALVTWHQANLWGNPIVHAELAAKDHPESFRAQINQAEKLMRRGSVNKVVEIFSRESEKGRLMVYPVWLYLGCEGGVPLMPQVAALNDAFARMPYAHSVLNNFGAIADRQEAGGCRAIEPGSLREWITVLQKNVAYQTGFHVLLTLEGRFFALEGRWAAALESFQRANALAPNIEISFLEIKSLWALERKGEARSILSDIEMSISKGPYHLRRYSKDVEYWRRHLE